MNVLKIYSIQDSAIGAFATPFYCTNDTVAIRMLTGLVNEPRSAYNVAPSDFTLYCLGSFDVLTGETTPEDPRRVRNGLALVHNVSEDTDSLNEMAVN